MSQRDLQDGQGENRPGERALERRLSRRRVVGAGLAGTAAIAGVGTLSRIGAAAPGGTSFRPAVRQDQAAEEGIRGGRLRVATTGQMSSSQSSWDMWKSSGSDRSSGSGVQPDR